MARRRFAFPARVMIGAAMLAPLLAPLLASQAFADESRWLQGKHVELQALDKITARIATIEAEVGMPLQYGSLQITVHGCTYRPPTLPPEIAAFMEVRTVDHNDVVADEAIFSGWMFASSPAVNALEHPVYDVTVLACRKD